MFRRSLQVFPLGRLQLKDLSLSLFLSVELFNYEKMFVHYHAEFVGKMHVKLRDI